MRFGIIVLMLGVSACKGPGTAVKINDGSVRSAKLNDVTPQPNPPQIPPLPVPVPIPPIPVPLPVPTPTPQPTPTPTPTPTPAPTPTPTPTPSPWPGLSICSKLDFNNLVWSTSVHTSQRDAFALALNISGSFEGDQGWQNLTNNFDGQGWSYGLLNQCLGQGSLQPLLIQMRDRYAPTMVIELGGNHFQSMLRMLAEWQANVSAQSVDLSDYGLSELDDPKFIEQEIGYNPAEQVSAQLLSKNQQSVNWAVANLYNGSSFKPDWKSELLKFANTSEFRSIQAEAAVKLHLRSMDYFNRFKMKETRSYLFFFDIVVQNGGISTSILKNIDAIMASHPSWDETSKLTAILNERLKVVNPKYAGDVRSRKASIINGRGVVHGSSRNYGKEYCAQLNAILPP